MLKLRRPRPIRITLMVDLKFIVNNGLSPRSQCSKTLVNEICGLYSLQNPVALNDYRIKCEQGSLGEKAV